MPVTWPKVDREHLRMAMHDFEPTTPLTWLGAFPPNASGWRPGNELPSPKLRKGAPVGLITTHIAYNHELFEAAFSGDPIRRGTVVFSVWIEPDIADSTGAKVAGEFLDTLIAANTTNFHVYGEQAYFDNLGIQDGGLWVDQWMAPFHAVT